jgi:hypothetical protein
MAAKIGLQMISRGFQKFAKEIAKSLTNPWP